MSAGRAWCPSDKRVRCINCRYLHRHNDDEAQCYNEDGPVAMWMFLADSEPKETWCEAFAPNDWLDKQGEMTELRSASITASDAVSMLNDRITSKLNPALNTGTAMDMLVLVGEALREVRAEIGSGSVVEGEASGLNGAGAKR